MHINKNTALYSCIEKRRKTQQLYDTTYGQNELIVTTARYRTTLITLPEIIYHGSKIKCKMLESVKYIQYI